MIIAIIAHRKPVGPEAQLVRPLRSAMEFFAVAKEGVGGPASGSGDGRVVSGGWYERSEERRTNRH